MRALKAHTPLKPPPDPFLHMFLATWRHPTIWKVILLHYFAFSFLIFSAWHLAVRKPPHPEIVLKLGGAYCFWVGVIVLPLLIPMLFFYPENSSSEPNPLPVPLEEVHLFDARFKAGIYLASVMLFPIIPLFLVVNPALGAKFEPLNLTIYLMALLSFAWVYLLAEMIGKGESVISKLTRGFGLISGFALLHIVLVGFLAQVAFPLLQRANPLKLLIDLNPLSQFFIIMQGPTQSRLIVNTDFQRLLDYRIYLFLIELCVFGIVFFIYRASLKAKPLGLVR